jgi:MFS superfamily sulfate permease-like transporter/CRP-like cAMP-binding protein
MSALPPPAAAGSSQSAWREFQAGAAGTLLSLGPALSLGLVAFAALGAQAAALGIPAALLASAVGGAVFALLSRGPLPAGGPSATPVLVVGTLVAHVVGDPSFAAAGAAAVPVLLALVAAAVVSMGVLQIALGLSGLLRFAKYVPQPVLAGFMNGVSLLAFLALLPLLLGWPADALHTHSWRSLPPVQPATLAIGLFTVAVIVGLPRLNPRLPATLIGMLAGSAAYALIHTSWPQLTLGSLTGALPAAWPHGDVLAPYWADTTEPLLRRHTGAALMAGLVMALIGTLELVLNSLAMDQACHTRTHARREALALGMANLASGLVGGLPLLFLRPRALRMRAAGGRTRLSTLFCTGLFAVLGLVGAPLLAVLPQVVLGAVTALNACLMADRWSLGLLARWLRGQRATDVHLALLVVVLVCTTTLLLGFPAAVAAGALLSVLLFVRTMNRSLVRTRCTGQAMPSRRIYMPEDEARLQPLRARITVLELEGALFFGSADRVAQVADELDASCHTLVLDFRRVSLVDASGAVVLSQLSRWLQERGIRLRLAGVSADNRHGLALSAFLGDVLGDELAAGHGAPDIDQAVETAELQLLEQAGVEALRQTVPLEQAGLMEGLDAAQRARLASRLQPRRLADGERLFRQGDPGDRLYVITAGSINVFSADKPASGTLPQRFVSLSPGMMLGETAMLDGQGRSGDAVAFGDTDVHALDQATLRQLQAEDPLLAARVYRNVALHLSQRLRAAAWAWRRSVD